jgi:hypothetical protein
MYLSSQRFIIFRTIEEPPAGAAIISRGDLVKRIILLATVGAVVAAVIAVSALSVSAQDSSGQTTDSEQASICAPWSKEWDVSKGWWYFQWYRWCYDPSTSDPSIEGNWYQELGDSEWWDRVNLCPESGSCTMTTG